MLVCYAVDERFPFAMSCEEQKVSATVQSRVNPGSAREVTWAGIALTLSALILYLPASQAADLGPAPDAEEYATTARNLAHFHAFTISLLNKSYPSRYPFGFPALLAPSYWLPHATLATGIYGVLAFGVASVVLVYVLARAVMGRAGAIAAAATLLLLPQFIGWTHEIMSETASIMLTAAAALVLYLTVQVVGDGARRALIVVLGGIAAVALLVHSANVILLAALIPVLVRDRHIRQEPVNYGLLFAIGPIVALAGLALYDQLTFGGVTRTGYALWVPEWYSSIQKAFGLRFAIGAPGFAGDGIPTDGRSDPPNILYYLGSLTGLVPIQGALLLPLQAALALIGCVMLARDQRPAVRALVLFGGLFSVLTVAFFSLYFFQTVRLLAPLAPLAALAVGQAVASCITFIRVGVADRRPLLAMLGEAVGFLALASLVVAMPAATGNVYLYANAQHRTVSITGTMNALTATTYRNVADHGAMIVTDVNLPFLDDANLTKQHVIISLTGGEYWTKPPLRGSPIFATSTSLVADALRHGMIVLTDDYSVSRLRDQPQLDPIAWRALQIYCLIPIAASPVIIYRLALSGCNQASPTSTATGSGRGRNGFR